MHTPHDPRPVRISDRIYWVLLRAYPRRFRQEYREEMALVFRDSCRQTYVDMGTRGLLRLWTAAVVDLVKNAPEEHVVRLTRGQEPDEPTLSCSGCYSIVSPDWHVCKICGTVLNAAPTHVTRAAPPAVSSDPEGLERIRKQWSGAGGNGGYGPPVW